MTETERNEKMRPDYIKNKSCSGLNLDGASLELSSDEDFEPQPSTSKYHEPNRGEKEKGSKSGRFASYESEDDLENDELPDLDPSPLSSREDRSDCVTPEPESEEYIKLGAAPQLTPTQRKNLVVPPKGKSWLTRTKSRFFYRVSFFLF